MKNTALEKVVHITQFAGVIQPGLTITTHNGSSTSAVQNRLKWLKVRTILCRIPTPILGIEPLKNMRESGKKLAAFTKNARTTSSVETTTNMLMLKKAGI